MICVNSVNVSPSSTTIKVGEWYYGARATVCPTNAACSAVKWSSSNTSIATVNQSSGYIYGKSIGTATIYATAQDGSGKRGCCTVTVSETVPVSSISLNRSCLTLQENTSNTLAATVCPSNASNKAISWSSSNTNVVTVSGGVVCAVGKGTATVTATALDGSGKKACCSVTVTGNTLVSSVTVTPASQAMTVGESTYLRATVCPTNATNKSVVWSSSNSNVVTVNQTSGLILAQSTGTAMLYATAQDGSGKRGCCTVTVSETVPVSSISLNRSCLTLQKGYCRTLRAGVCPTNASKKTVNWSSSNPNVATVNDGVVCGRTQGNATITASSTDGSNKTASCFVSVTESILVSSVKIRPAYKTLAVGNSTYLHETVGPTNAENKCVKWTSSDSSIVTVNPISGLVTARKVGTATIYATAQDGSEKYGGCIVKVNNTDLTTSQSRFGCFEYEGVQYDIFVPNHLETSIDAVWTTIDTLTASALNFDVGKFIAGIEFYEQEGGIIVPGDFKGEIENSVIADPKMKPAIGVAGIFTGILDAAVKSTNVVFVRFTFQETSDKQKRVIIEAGSTDIQRTLESINANIPISAYYSNAGNILGQAVISSSVADLYEEMTGKESNLFATYDCEMTVDMRHRNDNGAASYLWVNKDGEIIETPIIYPNDKIEFGVREGVWAFSSLNAFYQVPLGGSRVASHEYQELFHKYD